MKGDTRVEWSEHRPVTGQKTTELFFIIAECDGGHWSFSERSSWDVLWAPLEATSSLIERAEQERCETGVPFL